MKADHVLEDIINERYNSYNSGIGAQIEAGTVNFTDLEKYSLDKTQAQLRAATHSDHLEQIKDTINHYIIETLS